MGKKHFSIDLVFILSLFAIFTITAVATVLVGIKIYGFTANTMDQNFETRTLSSYLTEKIRQNDSDRSISLYDLKDIAPQSSQTDASTSALVLTSTIQEQDADGQPLGEKQYFTYLYLYDGFVRELTVSAENNTFLASAGQKVLAAKELSFELINDHLLHVFYTTESGQKEDFYLSPKNEISAEAANISEISPAATTIFDSNQEVNHE